MKVVKQILFAVNIDNSGKYSLFVNQEEAAVNLSREEVLTVIGATMDEAQAAISKLQDRRQELWWMIRKSNSVTYRESLISQFQSIEKQLQTLNVEFSPLEISDDERLAE